MSAKYKAIEIANFYIQLANSIEDDSIDNLKINKILYFAQGRALAKTGQPLFDDEFEAWDYGPVVPAVYHAYKCCGKNVIEQAIDTFDETRLSSEEIDILTDVYLYYGKYTGLALKEITHEKGTPWTQVYVRGENCLIGKDLIKDYFIANDKVKSLEINDSENNIIRAVPLDWDSEGDSVYGGV